LAFKRLAARLRRAGLAAVLALAFALACLPAALRAGDEVRAQERETVREVLAGHEFEVHTEREQVWEPRQPWRMPDWLRGSIPAWVLGMRSVAGTVLLGIVLLAVAGGVAWLLHRYRHWFAKQGLAGSASRGRPALVQVSGLDLSPEALPPDPAAVALDWWRQGRRREALGLLYRAAIVWFVERRQVEIGPAATEEDCLRRVAAAADEVEAAHFRRLTAAWIRLAYAGRMIGDEELAALCEGWPYRGGGAAG
jgi:hypothetical protein